MMEQLNSRSKEPTGGNDMDADYHKLSKFWRVNQPRFKGTFDPDEADEWMKEMKKIYFVLACLETQKVAFATSMLKSDGEF